LSFDVLVEVAGAPDHDDPKGEQDAERDQNNHGTLPSFVYDVLTAFLSMP
jgi:hypothetical protein